MVFMRIKLVLDCTIIFTIASVVSGISIYFRKNTFKLFLLMYENLKNESKFELEFLWLS